MATVRDVINRLAAIVEGTTPDTPKYGSARAFKHLGQAHDIERHRSNQSPTRQFNLVPTGDRSPVGAMGAGASPIQIEQTFDLAIQYKQATSAAEFFAVVCEDADRIAWRLMTPTLWDKNNTKISLVGVSGFSLLIDEAGANGVAVLTIPVTVRYWPTFQA